MNSHNYKGTILIRSRTSQNTSLQLVAMILAFHINMNPDQIVYNHKVRLQQSVVGSKTKEANIIGNVEIKNNSKVESFSDPNTRKVEFKRKRSRIK